MPKAKAKPKTDAKRGAGRPRGPERVAATFRLLPRQVTDLRALSDVRGEPLNSTAIAVIDAGIAALGGRT